MLDSNSKSGATATSADGRSARMSLFAMGRAAAVIAGGALVLGIILGPIVADNHTSAADSTAPEHVISVSGTGLVSVAPDTADISLGVSVTRPTAKEARTAAATAMTAVIDSIKKNGVAEKDIVTTGVNLNVVYDYSGSSRRLIGYEFANTVKVTVRTLDKAPAVIDDAVTAGATVVYGISFRLAEPAAQQNKARELAMADARAKADVLARAAGVQIKGVAAISETTSSYTPYYPAAMAEDKAGSSTPIQAGITDIRIQVTVAYLIG